MARFCSICNHDQRTEIESAVVRNEPNRAIACRFGMSRSAVARHKKNHMAESLAKTAAARAAVVQEAMTKTVVAEEAEQQERGFTVIEELERCFRRMNRMFDACDDWLRDPVEPGKYFIGPRTTEIDVAYFDYDERGNVIRRRAPLQKLLDIAKGHVDGEVVAVYMRHADPRESIFKAAKSLQSHMNFLAKLRGQLGSDKGMDAQTAEAWAKIRQIIIEELMEYPEVKIRIIHRLKDLGC